MVRFRAAGPKKLRLSFAPSRDTRARVKSVRSGADRASLLATREECSQGRARQMASFIGPWDAVSHIQKRWPKLKGIELEKRCDEVYVKPPSPEQQAAMGDVLRTS